MNLKMPPNPSKMYLKTFPKRLLHVFWTLAAVLKENDTYLEQKCWNFIGVIGKMRKIKKIRVQGRKALAYDALVNCHFAKVVSLSTFACDVRTLLGLPMFCMLLTCFLLWGFWASINYAFARTLQTVLYYIIYCSILYYFIVYRMVLVYIISHGISKDCIILHSTLHYMRCRDTMSYGIIW